MRSPTTSAGPLSRRLAGRAELHEWLSDFWSHKLDRTRPLWEMTRVDGLEGGRWMLATKTHHSMVDGVSSIDIGHILLDAEPRPAPRRSAEEGPEEDIPKLRPAQLAQPWRRRADRPRRAGRRPPPEEARGRRRGRGRHGSDGLARRGQRRAPVEPERPIGTTRRFTSVSLPLDDVKTVKRSLGGATT